MTPANIEKESESAGKYGISLLRRDDPDYPSLLKEIFEPPALFYCKGNPEILKRPAIALVGSRRPTPYGERMAENLAGDLASAGIVTVSGLARGIDTAVHRSTIRAGGVTVAVLGSGLLKVYPPENKRLFETISERGLVLSELPLDAEPMAGHFPMRNRIISGLSLGTVVIEAGEKSGALITAKLALEQGREVFAVPGQVTSEMSRGTNRLIKAGAKLVESCEDILSEIPVLSGTLFDMNSESRRKNREPLQEPEELTGQEKNLLRIIDSDPVHIDSLISSSRLSYGQISNALLKLELKGMVRSLPGKIYVRS